MLNEPVITCPNCRCEIKLTESLAAPLIETVREQYERKLFDKETSFAKRESALREQSADLERARAAIDEQVSERVKAERLQIVADEARKARALTASDLEQKNKEVVELQEVLNDRNTKLAEAQKAQAELVRKQRELDDAKREVELTVEKRVQEALGSVRDKAKLEAEESLKLRIVEREEQIASMQRQIEELRRKAEQGSQQLQGEAQELNLEATLRARFPADVLEPVPKGEFGGDVLHRVIGPLGQQCGTILWETKRTKNWSDSWLSKLRDDQRSAKADIALLVSHTLPKEIVSFDLVDGVWITEARCAVPVAIALRQTLIEIAGARQASEGQQSKMELVYQYLTGSVFRHRVEAIVEKFTDMQIDLERERRTMTRLWAKREAQIRGVIESTAGMYGDLQGIAGKSLKEIDGLNVQLHLLDAPKLKSGGAQDGEGSGN
jgi:hypothetical protein